VEVAFVVLIFSAIVMAMVCLQIFALRIYTLAATKLVATTGGREALNQIRDQIRQGKTVFVGNCTNIATNSFQYILTNSLQQGNALIIYPSTNATSYSVYYLDTSTNSNYKLTQFNVATNAAGQYVVNYTNVLASYLTNLIVFDMEDWQTNIQKSELAMNNRLLIRVTMQFSQWEYPLAFVGGAGTNQNMYDYYQLRTRVFRRSWN
jgi:hypothetical protein